MMLRTFAISFAVGGVLLWLWGVIGDVIFPGLTVNARDSAINGSLLFVAAAILWFIPAPNDKGP